MSAVIINDQNFEPEVINEKTKPVLVDFWAVWCHPCKIQEPIIEELVKDIGDKAKIGKMEVDESPNTAAKYNILSIPTLALFKDGKVVWQGVGVQQKDVLIKAINEHI